MSLIARPRSIHACHTSPTEIVHMTKALLFNPIPLKIKIKNLINLLKNPVPCAGVVWWSPGLREGPESNQTYLTSQRWTCTIKSTKHLWSIGCGVAIWVRRGYVVSASACCTAVPGSNPARHPSLGSAQENPGAEKYRSRFFPAQQQEIPAQQQAYQYQPITKDEYCINTVDRKLEK